MYGKRKESMHATFSNAHAEIYAQAIMQTL